MYLVSACLAGANCRYNGTNKLNPQIQKLVSQGKAIPVCPEQLGGLSVPRPPSEIDGGSGEDVLDGKARVIDREGNNVTSAFLSGAREVLKIAQAKNANKAIFKSKSPSCGCGQIYDGKFSQNLVNGNGVATALLIKNGIEVEVSEKKW